MYVYNVEIFEELWLIFYSLLMISCICLHSYWRCAKLEDDDGVDDDEGGSEMMPSHAAKGMRC